MNTTWQGITQVIEVGLPMRVQQFLAQSPSLQPTQPAVNQGIADVQGIVQQIILFTPRLLGAVAILLVGWLIAAIAAAVTQGILKRTNIDNRIAAGSNRSSRCSPGGEINLHLSLLEHYSIDGGSCFTDVGFGGSLSTPQ